MSSHLFIGLFPFPSSPSVHLSSKTITYVGRMAILLVSLTLTSPVLAKAGWRSFLFVLKKFFRERENRVELTMNQHIATLSVLIEQNMTIYIHLKADRGQDVCVQC